MRDDYEQEDQMESFLKFHQKQQKEAEKKAQNGNTETFDEYDSEEEMKKRGDKKKVEALPPIDHSRIIYTKIEKNFYKPPKYSMTPEEVKEFRRSHRMSQTVKKTIIQHIQNQKLRNDYTFTTDEIEIRVSWEKDWQSPPQPCRNFEDYGFEIGLTTAIKNAGYEVQFFFALRSES